MRLTAPLAALALTVLLVHAPTAHAELLCAEPFDYTGTGVVGQNGGTGWTSTWEELTTGSDLDLSSDDQSLAYPSTITYTATGERIDTDAGGASREFSGNGSLSFGDGSGTDYYISVLVRKDDAGAFTIRTNNTNGNKRLHFGINASESYFTDLFNNVQASSPGAAPVGETVLLVARFLNGGTGGDGNPDRVQLLAYTDGDVIPAAAPAVDDWLVTSVGETSVTQQFLEIEVTAGQVAIDEIRIGTDWAAVVAVPEPTTATAALGLLGLMLVAGPRRRRH